MHIAYRNKSKGTADRVHDSIANNDNDMNFKRCSLAVWWHLIALVLIFYFSSFIFYSKILRLYCCCCIFLFFFSFHLCSLIARRSRCISPLLNLAFEFACLILKMPFEMLFAHSDLQSGALVAPFNTDSNESMCVGCGCSETDCNYRGSRFWSDSKCKRYSTAAVINHWSTYSFVRSYFHFYFVLFHFFVYGKQMWKIHWMWETTI